MNADLDDRQEKRRFLLIDSDGFNSLVVTSLLDVMSIDVEHASDAETGFSKAEQNHFDAVMVNSTLPKTTGQDVARRIRELSLKMPVALIVEDQCYRDIITSNDPHIDVVICQPITATTLHAAVEKLLDLL